MTAVNLRFTSPNRVAPCRSQNIEGRKWTALVPGTFPSLPHPLSEAVFSRTFLRAVVLSLRRAPVAQAD